MLDRLDAPTKRRPLTDIEDIDITPKYLDADFEFLGNQTVRIWLANYELVLALAGEFGFMVTFVLQPSLWVDGKPLYASEKRILAEEFESRAMTHIMATRAETSSIIQELSRRGSLPMNVHNFEDVFNGVEKPLYIDYVHTTGRGNKIVAERLFGVLTAQLCAELLPEVSQRVARQIEAACN